MNIRLATAIDAEAIEHVIVEVFRNHPHSNNSEYLIVSALRDQHALKVSLVAENNGIVIGHIAFSEVEIAGHYPGWYGLAPVSVAISEQHKGIGTMLIEKGIGEIQFLGASGCVLVGDPDYYQRFGFVQGDKLIYEHDPAEYFMWLRFSGKMPRGVVEYHPAFTGVV